MSIKITEERLDESLKTKIDGKEESSAKGAPNGYASLGPDCKVVESQIDYNRIKTMIMIWG